MKHYAFAALLALPLLGLASQDAAADYYCCGKRPEPFITKDYYVHKKATVFDCDGWQCETKITLYDDLKISARCRNGWCEVRSFPFKEAWVLESCLKPLDSHFSYKNDDYDEADDDAHHRRLKAGYAVKRRYGPDYEDDGY